MIDKSKPVDSLTPADLTVNHVWRYVDDDLSDETLVRPVEKIPVRNLTGVVIGTQVRLANGTLSWALLGNIDSRNPRLTKHFLTLSLEHAGHWIRLARYHDHDVDQEGPEALARAIGLDINAVFPISYDVHEFAQGDPAALVGSIPRDPEERLTRAQIIALAVPKRTPDA